jgi:formate dehydrogenase major subunit
MAGICNFCGTGCGHFLQVEEGVITGVVPSQSHPVSKGKLCVRGWHIHELLRTDERITEPLVRRNGSMEKVSYEEAITMVNDIISKISSPSEEVAVLASPRSSNEDNYLLMKLARSVFKTNNLSCGSESGHRSSLNVLYKGTGMAGMTGSIEEIQKAEVILVVGSDIGKLNPIVASNIHIAAMKGAKLITISSTASQIAKLSSIHIQQKPGMKKIVLNTMAKCILDENLQDKAYIDKYTAGFKDFESTVKSINAGTISETTGVAFEEIRNAARILAGAKTAMAFFTSGISGLNEETIAALFNLFVLTGKIGKEGCGVNPVTGISNLQGAYDMGVAPDILPGFKPLNDKTAAKIWNTDINAVPGKFVYDLIADDSSKLKILIVAEHDEGIIRYADQIKEMDIVIYIGAFENKFTELADIVIPVADYVEYDGTYTNFERRIQLSAKKVEPNKNVIPAWKLYTMIAAKAGQNWNYKNSSDVMDEIAKVNPDYAKVTHAKLANTFGIQWPCDEKNENGSNRLKIESMKDKINFVSSGDGKTGETKNSEYQYELVVGKSEHFWHQNNLMRKTFIPKREFDAMLLLYPEGFIEISGEDAKKLAVRDKWPVSITSAKGSMKAVVKISEDVKSGTAYIPYFIQDTVSDFLLKHNYLIAQGEEAIIPIKIEKV